jgi:hypothetical protein
MAGPWEKYGQQQPGFTALTPPDPYKANAERRADASDVRADEANRRAAAAAERAATNEAARIALERQKFEQAQHDAANPPLTDTQKAAAIAGYNSADAIEKLVKDIEEKFAAGPGKTKGIKGLWDFLPSTVNDQFDTAGQSVRGQVGTALGFTGGQLNSPIEAKMAVGPYIPQSSDRDATVQDKIQRLKDLAQQARHRSVQVLGGIPDVNGNIVPIQQQSLAHGATRNVADPRANALVTRLIRKNFSDEEINAALGDIGSDPVAPESLKAIRAFEKKHSGTNYSGATKGVPTSLLNRTLATPGGAFATNYLDGASMGGASLLAGQEGRDKLHALNSENWKSALAGNALGGMTSSLGIGRALGATRLAPWMANNPLKAAALGDAAYGGTYGFNTADDGNGALGAGLGVAGGLAGNALGAGATKALGGTMRGVVDPSVEFLRSRGIKLTGGQIAGGMTKRIEDTLAGYGFAGAPLRNRLTEGLEDLNRAGYRTAGEPIGHAGNDIGRAGLDSLNTAKGAAYDSALNGMNLTLDPAYTADRALADATGAALPDTLQPIYNATLGKADSFIQPGGQIPGRSAQAIKQTLRREMKANRNVPGGQFVGDALGQADDAFMGLAARQEPAMTAQYRQADLAHGRSKVLERAVNAASGKPGDPGVWTGAQLSSALKGANVTRDAQQALQPLADNAIRILPSQVPDSGTAGRLALGAVAAGSPMAALGYATGGQEGAETGGAGALGTVLSIAALNTKAGRATLEKMLLDRPDIMRRLGGMFGQSKFLGGAGMGAGAGAANILGN